VSLQNSHHCQDISNLNAGKDNGEFTYEVKYKQNMTGVSNYYLICEQFEVNIL
jgi:hypothetical protein